MSCKWGIQNAFFTQARYPATFPAALGSTSHAPASWPAAEGGGAAEQGGHLVAPLDALQQPGGWGGFVLTGTGWSPLVPVEASWYWLGPVGTRCVRRQGAQGWSVTVCASDPSAIWWLLAEEAPKGLRSDHQPGTVRHLGLGTGWQGRVVL